MQKDLCIVKTLSLLEERFGADAFHVVDHWQPDLRAVGIAHTRDHQRLVYIAMFGNDDRYDVELETAPLPGAELPYAVAGRFRAITFDELVTVVGQHLQHCH